MNQRISTRYPAYVYAGTRWTLDHIKYLLQYYINPIEIVQEIFWYIVSCVQFSWSN